MCNGSSSSRKSEKQHRTFRGNHEKRYRHSLRITIPFPSKKRSIFFPFFLKPDPGQGISRDFLPARLLSNNENGKYRLRRSKNRHRKKRIKKRKKHKAKRDKGNCPDCAESRSGSRPMPRQVRSSPEGTQVRRYVWV
jgi:hypothetical protein